MRDALAPVLGAAGLSVRDTPPGLALRRVTSREVTAIARDDIAVGDGPLASRRRPDPSEEVGQLSLGYVDRERDYLAGTVTAKRLSGSAAAAENSGLVLDLQGARRAAERMLLELTSGRDTLEFALPPSMAALEVGDAISLEGQGEGPFEITEIRDGAVRRVTARAVPPVTEAAIVVDRPRSAVAAAPVARALPVMVAAHLPPEPAAPLVSRLMLAASASPWPGHVAVNDAATGARVARLGRNAAMGELTEPLGAGPVALWDQANALTVTLYSGHLAPADDAAVFAGTNRVAVELDTGGWEVIGFAEAALLSPSAYRLSQLLRGQMGTALGVASAGRRVVVLDGRAVMSPVPAAWLGEEVALRAYAGAADPTGTPFTADLGLAPILPLAPVHLRARRNAGTGDVTLDWVRRSRADTDSWTPADAPHDNPPEAYRVTILDGSTPVRTTEVAAPSLVYAAAEQAADFGAPPASFAFTVAQLSPVYGPGHAAAGAFDA